MSHIDIKAFEEASEAKVTAKPKEAIVKLCKANDCENIRAYRNSLCEDHKAEAEAIRLARYGDYRNLVREAATTANATNDTDTDTYLVRLSDGRAGFAYFAKEFLPNYVVASKPFGGLVLQVEGRKYAKAFAKVLANSDIAKLEQFSIELITYRVKKF